MTTEAELIERARRGDDAAMAELFRRHYSDAVWFAASKAGASDAEDIVAESFDKVFAAMAAGKGPDVHFRSYLYTTIRRAHIDHLRKRRHEMITGSDLDLDPYDTLVGDDQADARAESEIVARAFATLPERWRDALWWTIVEEWPLAKVAERLAMNPNAVAALCFRAREGLRNAYLAQHLALAKSDACREALEQVPKYIRGTLSARAAARLRAHLATCASCTLAVAEARQINTQLGAVLLPALGVVTVGGAGSTLVVGSVRRLRRKVSLAAAAVVGAALIGGAAAAARPWGSGADHRARPLPPARFAAVERPLRARPTPRASAPRPAPTSAPPTTSRPAEPSASPTYAQRLVPIPTAVRPTQPLARPVDASIGSPDVATLTTGGSSTWVHLGFPVSGGRAGLELQLTATDVIDFQLHRDDAFGAWTCRQQRGVALALSCRLSLEHDRPQGFGIDLELPAGETSSVSGVLTTTTARDPNVRNNSVEVVVP